MIVRASGVAIPAVVRVVVRVGLATIFGISVAVEPGTCTSARVEVDEALPTLTLGGRRVVGIAERAASAAVIEIRVQVRFTAVVGSAIAVRGPSSAGEHAASLLAGARRGISDWRREAIIVDDTDLPGFASFAFPAAIDVRLTAVLNSIGAARGGALPGTTFEALAVLV